ncbi:DoxX family membrane protein [Jatrophihabitans sp.]|uniref:DoxX family membrane protein n=1 Tax=Jatrophihabitans sp. TaxID=1932789 RepID=UPI002C937002|nr:DoxX family protein [Jatrophihabitans sp.]
MTSMVLVRAIARPLLAASFISGGVTVLRNPAPRVAAADRVLAPLAARVPQLSNTEQVVKADAAAKVVAGSLLALGKLPRLSATVLAVSLVPTTLAGHRFWEEPDPVRRTQQRLHLTKNAGLLGGLLLAAVDTQGRPSLGWWARRTPWLVRHTASGLRRDTEHALHSAVSTAAHTAGELRRDTGHALHSAAGTVRDKLPV